MCPRIAKMHVLHYYIRVRLQRIALSNPSIHPILNPDLDCCAPRSQLCIVHPDLKTSFSGAFNNLTKLNIDWLCGVMLLSLYFVWQIQLWQALMPAEYKREREYLSSGGDTCLEKDNQRTAKPPDILSFCTGTL